ncbi:MAG: prepilin peptidase [bacterium]
MQELNTLLSQNSQLLLALTAVLGLLVGSFLNVVIYRLPIMLERRWKNECAELNSVLAEDIPEHFNLVTPRSSCPSCGHVISALENIPIISYLVQGGKCKNCGSHISVQYPLIELVTAALSAVAAWQFGYSWETLFALGFTWALIALTVIDFKTQLLPDIITLPLLWAGLLVNLFGTFTDYQSSLLGAVFGYLSLWTVFQVFKLVTGKEGMGHGDFKILAAIGAWAGWQILPLVVILSSVVGAIAGIVLITSGKQEQGTPMPFGPFLAIAGWIAFFWGTEITQWYLRLSGM